MQTEEVRLVKYDRTYNKVAKKNGEVTVFNAHHFRVSFRWKDALEKKRVRVKRAAAVLYVGEGSIFRPFSYTESASINRTFWPWH
jgi:hypothetical protein